MSNTTPATLVPAPEQGVARSRRLSERGMATVEYAIGVVLVVVMIGVIIVAIQSGTLDRLVQELMDALFAYIGKAFSIPVPGVPAKP